jgi:hypothetical protein
MAEKQWETIKVCYCEHVRKQVALEAETIYPDDFLPDPPRVVAHRCSKGMECNRYNQAVCVWAGTNPDVDPFRQ